MTSVNTNYGALVALQSLNQTGRELAEVQNRVNTGLKVASAKDNGAVFAIAEGQRTRIASLSAVTDGIDRATSTIDVGLSAGQAIGDILKQMKEKAVAAQATDLSTDQRAALQADFDALRNQINQIANGATFNGSNLVNGANLTSGGNALRVLTSDIGSATGSAGAGQFVRGAAVVASIDGGNFAGGLTLDSNVASGSATDGTGDDQAIQAGDAIRLTYTATGDSVTVAFQANDTLGEYLDRFNAATGGRVSASLDEDTGTIVYTGSEAFTTAFVETTTGATDAAAAFEALFTGTSGAYVAGGGFQANGTALTNPLSGLALLSDVGAVATSGDNVQFQLFGADGVSGGGDDRTFQIELDGEDTIDEFVNKVSQATGGAVTAIYNEETGGLTYQSAEDFLVTVTGAALQSFLGNAAAASKAPNASSGAGAGANEVRVSGFDFRLGVAGQALSGVTSALDVSTSGGASTASSAIDSALTNLNRDLAKLGAQSKALEIQKTFLGKLSDSIEAGIGNLVDADLAKESARLQALQVKQQLGAQALSIANQAPSIVLSFFR